MKIQFYYVYILFSQRDKNLYIGFTENLKVRLSEHFKGRVVATKNRKPLVLIHYEAFTNKDDAKAREEFLKSGFGRSQLKKALQRRFQELGYKHLCFSRKNTPALAGDELRLRNIMIEPQFFDIFGSRGLFTL